MSSIWDSTDSSLSLSEDVDNPWKPAECVVLDQSSNLTNFERIMKKKFTFETQEYKEFSDLKIYTLQNQHRYHQLKALLKFPNITPFSSVFCVFNAKYNGYRAERFLQRRVCLNCCNWDPSNCFLEDSHSGDFKDIMHRDFLELYNPGFSSMFGSDKSALRLKVDKEKHPRIHELVLELGISSDFSFNEEGSPVTHEYLAYQFRNAERPLYTLEEKKVNDIIFALLEASEPKVKQHEDQMSKVYLESLECSGNETRPILSLMMWGPQTSNHYPISSTSCILETDSWNKLVLNGVMHKCNNFIAEHHWMFGHGVDVSCRGPGLLGPGMTENLTVIYPCSKNTCCIDCTCNLCESTRVGHCNLKEHKKHLQRFDLDCLVQKQSQCQIHWVSHPDNFVTEEDILVEKNVFFHNGQLVDQPRNHAVEIIKLAGLKRSCFDCRNNVHDHFKNHLDYHLQCKICAFQMATLEDILFWKRVCNICGKVVKLSEPKRLNWHKKIHEESKEHIECKFCNLVFKRTFTLNRHMQEDHKTKLWINSLEECILNQFENNEEENEEEIHEPFECLHCKKEFRLRRYLDRHISNVHIKASKSKCNECDREFLYKKDFDFHQFKVHLKKKTKIYKFLQDESCKHQCRICGSKFQRKDYLKRHIKTHDESKFQCDLCEKKFTRRDNLKLHVEMIHTVQKKIHCCDFCNQKFKRKFNLIRHKKRLNHM